ncbi:hypothetical protein L1987_06151 [Smallanthus sonchifolius]|uniref:Uncharacterized protein n=1 Tax=Smallanthus sonchifolius TaxID=185202 RepID=A0ACB9JXA8_9ASTR|nr:hypothetical protein L1987_06151 [Smallanthus sonchifolius]
MTSGLCLVKAGRVVNGTPERIREDNFVPNTLPGARTKGEHEALVGPRDRSVTSKGARSKGEHEALVGPRDRSVTSKGKEKV